MVKALVYEKTRKNYFDAFTEYDQKIRKWVPCYDDMMDMIVFHTPREVKNILDLGCGNGNLSALIIAKFPEACIHLVDSSSCLLDECKYRFRDNNRSNFIHEDFRALSFPKASLDLVVSSIAIHHLTDSEKEDLFRRIFEWLEPNGMLCYADIFRSGNLEMDEFHYRLWRRDSSVKGASKIDWDTYIEHERNYDYPSILREHIDLLGLIGFTNVYCPWKYSFWTQVIAYK